MVFFSPTKPLILLNPFSTPSQSKQKSFFPSPSKSLLHTTPPSPSAPDWAEFASKVSGEWGGCAAEFSAGGNPLKLPESVVPAAFRDWGVEVFEWQTQCQTIASGTGESLFSYKLIKLLPTAGCDADDTHSVGERFAGGGRNNVMALGYCSGGGYVCVGMGKGVLELEHCFVDCEKGGERVRVVQVVGLEEGGKLRLERIWVFWECWNGEGIGECVGGGSGFALSKAVLVEEVLGEWEGIERFAVDGLEDLQKVIFCKDVEE